ncbi:MAG TPA: inositol monophosphatase family protein [Candidatus Dietzia intestinipullorum]|nr:inositol monophosphatase family protein [Candidatus Dietzia intestinipullorum]
MTDRRVDTVPTDLPVDPAEALAVASRALDEVTPRFIEGVGAEATRIKESRTDFATELDLELERRLSDALREGTGLEVHGEEFGGPSVHSGTLWVLDPIDGTANYSLGIPTTGILAALVHDRQPVLGLTWLPLLGLRFTSIAGGALQQNGEDLPAISDVSIRDVALGLGSLKTGARTTYPPAYRREVFEQLTVDAARTRKFGSTGVDLSFVASGRLSSAVSFGNYAWDNAAGASHVRAAGGVVTDLAGNEWSTESQSMLAAGPRAHEEVLSIVRQLGDPSNFSESGRRRATPEPEAARPRTRDGR